MIRGGGGRRRRSSPPRRPSITSPRELDRILQQHGPGAIAFYLSGQLTTESQYLASKFAKGCLRTNHVDSNSRLCMASAASGMTLSLGSDGPPTCYADIELADAFLFVGSNAAECHPVMFDRVAERLRSGGAQVHRRRSPPHRDRRGRRRAPAPSSPAPTWRCSTACSGCCATPDKLDRAFIAAHTEGWDELERAARRVPARARRRDLRHRARRPPRRRARSSIESEAADHVLDDGRQPDAPGHVHAATRSSTCTWRPARSASPAAGRSA